MSDRVIGECLVCHLWPTKPLVLSCLHIVCSMCRMNSNVCPKCQEMSTESVITVEKKLCVGCKKNSEAVIKCRHCLCVECKTRPKPVFGCSICHWICSDCITYHEELTLYDKHVLERENTPQEISEEIIDCVKNKREELEREESEWKDSVERDMRDVLQLERLEKKMNEWIISIQKIIVKKLEEIVRQKNTNENVINCFNYVETFVNEIVPKMSADMELRKLLINKLNKCEIVKKDIDENNSKKVLENIIVDISKLANDSQEQPAEYETTTGEECEIEVIRIEIVSVSDHSIQIEMNGQIEDIELSDIVREDNETNLDVLDKSEEQSLISTLEDKEELEYNPKDSGYETIVDYSMEDNDRLESKDCDEEWKYSSAEDVEEDSDYQTYGEFKCYVCKRCFGSKRGLIRHRLLHKRVKRSLPSKVQTLDSSSQLEANQWKTFSCEECGKEFDKISDLKSHKAFHRFQRVRPYACDHFQCNKRFFQKSGLKQHKQIVHCKDRPFKCDHKDCNKTFKSKYYVKQHIEVVHNNIRPFPCEFPGCSHRSHKRSGFKTHARTHTEGERKDMPFKCDYKDCKKTFKSKYYVKEHIEVVHNNRRPHPCDFPGCSHRSKTKSHLKFHARTHTGEKPFVCDICGTKYNRNDILLAHRRRIHQATHN